MTDARKLMALAFSLSCTTSWTSAFAAPETALPPHRHTQPAAAPKAEAPVASSGAAALQSTAAETMIVTGTHSAHRRARESLSPIDILSAAALQRSGQPNVADALARIDPSITMNALGRDTEALTSQIRLRGLTPNQTLILVDGKRRHTTANVIAFPGPQQGSTPADLNMIPSSAIDHIEVLRDGAATQYGSDAIAGVVNVVLKKTAHGLHANAQTGAYPYLGNGWQAQLNADGGLRWGGNGYLHLSGQYYHTDHAIIPVRDIRNGLTNDPFLSSTEETRESLALEFGKPLTESIDFFGKITYAHRHAEAYELLRLPSVLPTIYPYGFVPIETIEENDYASTLGLKGALFRGISWSLTTTWGADHDNLGNKQTGNTNYFAMTGMTPTSFHVGTYGSAQWTNDLDFTKHLALGGPALDLAWGAEHRLEIFSLSAGSPLSYLYGGSQAQQGLTPQNAGSWSRDIWAGYVDVDTHVTKKLDIDFAGRFEHYTDFGNTENGKLSARYAFTPRFAIRGTISNGFRAPTLAEEHFSTLGLQPNGATALLPANSYAASLLGASALKPERSTNASAGFYLEPVKGLHVTTDVYQINIRDRIVAGGSYNGSAALTAVAAMGASLASGVDPRNVSANYFSNGASTRTQGLDISADYLVRLHRYGNVALNVGLDLNRTRLHHLADDLNGNPLLNAQGIGYLTTESPRSKLILNAYWTYGKFDVNLRQTRWGQTKSMMTYEDQAPAALQYSKTHFYQFVNTPAWLTDIELGYQATSAVHLALGANDIFNVRPRRMPLSTSYYGVWYFDKASAQIPMFGGYYYFRANISL